MMVLELNGSGREGGTTRHGHVARRTHREITKCICTCVQSMRQDPFEDKTFETRAIASVN